ncbi:MAG: GNAT family N-acetyltransferase [Coriobacteriales bacterium]|jgi:GNAT superfamily N-acetyltransferase|nr:GNAT family N-acetyltransferase [Coriobacteriales bacterium]
MGFAIRELLPEQAGEYTACHIACWRAAYRGIIPDEYLDNMLVEHEQLTERLRQSLNQPGDVRFYCAVFNDRIIGRLIISQYEDDDRPTDGEVRAIYLLPEFWDKGYGRQLMDFALEVLRQTKHQTAVVWVLEENNRARRFYSKYGFETDGAQKEIILGKPLVALRYVLNL